MKNKDITKNLKNNFFWDMYVCRLEYVALEAALKLQSLLEKSNSLDN